MISKDKGYVEKSFDELFNSIDGSDLLAVEARILMFRFLGEVDKICRKREISRKELAVRTGTSASYITQLFQGKKIINFLMLAKIQKVLNISFNIEVSDNENQSKRGEAIQKILKDSALERMTGVHTGLLTLHKKPVFHGKGSLTLKGKKLRRPEKTL